MTPTTAPTVRPVLLLDMDGVIADFPAAAFQLAADLGLTLDIDHHNDQHLFELDGHVIDGTSNDQLIDDTIRADPDWFARLPVAPGAVEAVAELEAHFDVWIVSKPMLSNYGSWCGKYAWIDKHFPSLRAKVILTRDKSKVVGDFLVDDALSADEAADATWQPIVFTQPYNGPGSKWADLPHWHWSDGIDALLALTDGLRVAS